MQSLIGKPGVSSLESVFGDCHHPRSLGSLENSGDPTTSQPMGKSSLQRGSVLPRCQAQGRPWQWRVSVRRIGPQAAPTQTAYENIDMTRSRHDHSHRSYWLQSGLGQDRPKRSGCCKSAFSAKRSAATPKWPLVDNAQVTSSTCCGGLLAKSARISIKQGPADNASGTRLAHHCQGFGILGPRLPHRHG